MATLVLSGVGGAVAGPLGAAIGRVAGREIDKSLRGSGQSGRLSDLRIQTSHYGAMIPALHGKMRVAGTVIWATDLVENALVSKGGSRRAYSVNFAVALSSRQLFSAGQIWADGRLIRGAAGDHKTRFKVRFHSGSEDQLPDPMIVSAEASKQVPAYRGLALLVFEDFDLSTFGNRLPQITAEVDAGDEPRVASLLEEQGLIEPAAISSADMVGGYALDGEDVEQAVTPLLLAFAPRFSLHGDRWTTGGSPISVDVNEREILAADQPTAKIDEEPFSRVSVRYFDASLDYATGEKAAHLPTTDQRKVLRIELPAVVDSNVVKGLAQARLADGWSSRNQKILSLPLSRSDIRLGDLVKLPGHLIPDLEVRSKRVTATDVTIALGAVRLPSRNTPSEAGRGNAQSDVLPGSIELILVELPPADNSGQATIGLGFVGGRKFGGRLPVSLELAGRTQETVLPDFPVLRGQLLVPLSSSPVDAFDLERQILVEVENDGWLTSCGDVALLGGANLLRVGNEFLQFSIAEPITPGKFRLSKLLRGRFASDVPAVHEIGTSVHSLERETFTPIQLPSDAIGAQLAATSVDLLDQRLSASLRFTGESLRPKPPVHLHWARNSGLLIKWIRRSRSGAAWLDNVDVPVGESRELYRVEVISAELKSRVHEISSPELFIAQIDLDELGNAPFQVTVQQVGDFGISLPAKTIIT